MTTDVERGGDLRLDSGRDARPEQLQEPGASGMRRYSAACDVPLLRGRGLKASSPESVEKSFYAVGRLVFEDFDAAFHLSGGSTASVSTNGGGWGGGEGGGAHIDFGRLCKSSDGMDVVVEDDDPDHHSQAERHRLLAGEATAVFPGGTQSRVRNADESGWERWRRHTHGVSSMTLHTVAMVLRQSVVFSMGRFLFCEAKGKVRRRKRAGALAPTLAVALASLTSDTNFVVPSLNVFSMGVASA